MSLDMKGSGHVYIEHLQQGAAGLEDWDQFLMDSTRGHYCQLSTWLGGFRVYGFRFRVITAREQPSGRIVGGLGILEFGKAPLKLVTSPIGPILAPGQEDLFRPLVEEALQYARACGAFLFQLQVPFSEEMVLPATLPRVNMPEGKNHRRGLPFATTHAPNQMLWIEYRPEDTDDAWADRVLKRFNNNTRRNIRKSEDSGLAIRQATTQADLQEAYHIIEVNGREQGYSTRSWREFGDTLIEQVKRDQAVVLLADFEGRYVGSHYALLAGRRYSYIMGGTLRLDKDLKVGHFVHWQAMKKARALGLDGYDLTSGGSPGVMRFKMGFRPHHVRFVEPHYYVLSAVPFAAFTRLYPMARKYKGIVARMLSRMPGRSPAK